MPLCTRGVTFPVKELFESILASPPFSKDKTLPVRRVLYRAEHAPLRLSEETERLLRILADRFDEQFLACGESDAGEELIEPGGIESTIRNYPPEEDEPPAKMLWNYFQGAEFRIEVKSDREYSLSLKRFDRHIPARYPSANLWLTFVVDREKNSTIITNILANDNLQKALDFFDPLGTGYEFFTPDQVERFREQYPDGRWPNHIELTSPEIRQYPNPPSLLGRLRGEFRANQYPDQAEAFKAYEQRLRRDDQGGDTKRRRMQWAIGSSGYNFD